MDPTVEIVPNAVYCGFDKTIQNIIGCPAAWDAHGKGEGIVVAILDTGCDTSHPALKDHIIATDCFIGGNVDDVNGHGTRTAGLVLTTAPECKLLVVKVLSKKGGATESTLCAAVKAICAWRGPAGERVSICNMSFGGASYMKKLDSLIDNAAQDDILFICAAGNSGDGDDSTIERDYPASFHSVVSVGACKPDGKPYAYCNSNIEIDIWAPGTSGSTDLRGTWSFSSGTSVAAPLVSGAAAVYASELLACNKTLPHPAEIRARLLDASITKQGHVNMLCMSSTAT